MVILLAIVSVMALPMQSTPTEQLATDSRPVLLAASKIASSKSRKGNPEEALPSKFDGSSRKSERAPKAAKEIPAEVEEEVEEVEALETVETVNEPSAGDQSAPTERDSFYSDAFPIADRLIDHYTAKALRPGEFATLIKHRNRQTFLKEPFRDGLGFDGGGLKIGLGLRYGILPWLDVGLLRMNNSVEIYDTYELDARFQILRQENVGLDLAARLGTTIFLFDFNPKNIASGILAQLIASYLIDNFVLLNGLIMYHSNSSSIWKDNTSTSPWTIAVGIGSEFRLLENFGIDLEMTYGLAGFTLGTPTLLIAPKIFTNRHTFAITIANGQYFTADSLITNVADWNPDKWTLGFQITREL